MRCLDQSLANEMINQTMKMINRISNVMDENRATTVDLFHRQEEIDRS